MLLQIRHETTLRYSRPVSETVLEVRVSPLSDEDQTTLGYRLRIDPPAPVTAYRDGFGNRVELFNVATPYQELTVSATSYVRTHRRDGASLLARVPHDPDRDLPIEVIDFLRPSGLADHGPALDAFLGEVAIARGGPLVDTVRRLTEAVRGRLRYEKRVTTSRTTVGEALALGRGVCQDYTHLFLAACRGLGIPARYVSGYLHAEGEVETHAWCQVWGGPAGWVDVDPTHGVFAGDGHVTAAYGRDYDDVPPNRGVWKGRAAESIQVAVTIERVERVPVAGQGWSDSSPWYEAVGPRVGNGGPYGRGGRASLAGRRASERGSYRHQQGQQQQEG